jgi:fructose-1,6-bisphosphatase/inositol monophosphatase family enzyme
MAFFPDLSNSYFMEFVSMLTWRIWLCFHQIVEEAGGVVSRMDGGEYTVFDRSVLVSNGAVHEQVSF